MARQGRPPSLKHVERQGDMNSDVKMPGSPVGWGRVDRKPGVVSLGKFPQGSAQGQRDAKGDRKEAELRLRGPWPGRRAGSHRESSYNQQSVQVWPGFIK